MQNASYNIVCRFLKDMTCRRNRRREKHTHTVREIERKREIESYKMRWKLNQFNSFQLNCISARDRKCQKIHLSAVHQNCFLTLSLFPFLPFPTFRCTFCFRFFLFYSQSINLSIHKIESENCKIKLQGRIHKIIIYYIECLFKENV